MAHISNLKLAEMSLQSGRTQAYSSDLRWRMVYQRCLLGLPYKEIAMHLNVDESTVCRIVNLFEETGTVSSIQGYRETPEKKMSLQDQCCMISVIVDNPPTYLQELKSLLLQSTGKDVSTACICNLIHKCGFSRKKLPLMEYWM